MAISNYKKLFLGVGGVLFLGWLVWDARNEPSVQDLTAGFEEVAVFRNENNTGPIQRVYAVTVADPTQWGQMQQYGQLMPHTKYGNTRVYFFAAGQPVPQQLQPGTKPFPAAFNAACLALYEKDLMGKISFKKQPFL